MGPEQNTISKADALAEAYKRGLLPPDKKAAYEEAQKRGLVKPLAPASPAMDPLHMVKPEARPQVQANQQTRSLPMTPRPDPNAPNPIITAQRQSQVDAGNAFAAKAKTSYLREGGRTAVDEMGRPLPADVQSFNEGDAYAVDRDVGKGALTLPVRAVNAASNTLESAANLPGDALQSMMGGERAIPRADVPSVPLPKNLESVTGDLSQGIMQFLMARGVIGKMAPGGGNLANAGKDAAALFAGFDSDTPRLTETLAADFMRQNGMGWMADRNPNNPLMERVKNGIEEMFLAYAPVEAVKRAPGAIDAITGVRPNNLTPTNAGAAPRPQPAPQPSVAPVTPAPQARATGAGQQANASPPPVGGQTLNATAQAAPQNVTALAKSDARNLRNLMRAAGVPRNDVDALLVGMVQDFNRLNDPRQRLAFFAAEYLPQKLPKPVADAVLAQFDAFGFQQLTDSGPGAGVMKASIDEVRDTQKPYLEGEFDAAFGKQDLITTKGKVRKLKADNADAIYKSQIKQQQELIAKNASPKEQITARDELLKLMEGEDFYKRIPEELAFRSRNEGFGALSDYVKSRPLESAHWLQSRLGELARKGGDNAGMYREMRTALLKQIEEAVPGYRGARRQHGDAIGQELAVTFGKEVRAAAGDRLKIAELAEEYRALPKSQQTVARLAMKEALTNEFRKLKGAARVDPATGNAIDPQQVMITQLQKEGVMDALETIFGKPGERATEAIRKVMRENEGLPKYRSDTAPNLKKQEGAVDAVRSPTNRLMRGVSDKTGYSFTVPADIVGAAMGVPPVFTASKVAGDLGSFLSKPNPKKMASTANVLYGMKPAGGPPPGTSRRRRVSGPSGQGAAKAPPPPPSLDALVDLRRQYDLVDPGASPREAERIRKAILRMEKDLSGSAAPAKPKRQKVAAAPAAPNTALGTSAKPPEKMGFGGSRDLPMDEASRMSRAREMGFDVDTPLFHGTAGDVEAFDPRKFGSATDARSAKLGVWLTSSPDTAAGYAKLAAEDTPVSKILKLADEAERKGNWDEYEALTRAAEAKERDIAKNGGRGANVMPLYVRGKIKSVDMDGAKYDPADTPLSEMAAQAKAEGYDGLRLQNFSDEGGWGRYSPTDHVLIFDPKNIRGKFAKFDPSESSSSKLLAGMSGNSRGIADNLKQDAGIAALGSVGGSFANQDDPQAGALGGMGLALGAKYGGRAVNAVRGRGKAPPVRGADQATFGGRRGADTLAAKGEKRPQQALDMAESMAAKGASRDEIWDATSKYLEGTPYAGAVAGKHSPDGKSRFEIDDSGAKLTGARSGPLGSVMDHPELYQAYPDLAALNTVRTPWKGGGDYIPPTPFNDEVIRVGDVGGDARSIALHEAAGHGVQRRERFPNGASTKLSVAENRQQLLDDIEEAKYWTERYRSDGAAPAKIRAAEERVAQLEAQFDATQGLSKSQYYRRSAGEVEARNVQTRRNFTPEQRRARAPWTTQDVPDDQQIVRFASGKAESRPTPPKGQKAPPKGPTKKAPPKKAEEVALINALKKARATETATRRRNVMRDNRDELNRPAEEAVMQAERDLLEYRDRQFRQAAEGARWMDRGAAVANVGKKAAVATGNQIKKTMMKNDAELLKTYAFAVGGIGATALGMRALAGPDGDDDKKNEVLPPTDKRYFVETKLKKRPEMLGPVQNALVELGMLDVTDADTKWGTKTKDALAAYLSRKPDRLPDLPLQDYEVPALLAEAYGGYQENGKWFYNTGEPIVYPPKQNDTYLPARPLRPDEARRMAYEKRTEAERNNKLRP